MNNVPRNTQYSGVYPEFIPEICSPDSQQGNVSSLAFEFTLGVCLLAFLPGVGGYRPTKYNLRKITYEIIKELCKINPILSAVGGLQMNVSNMITRNYKNFIPLAGYKNKANSNPIKPNLRKAKMNINSIITKDYRKKDDFSVRINKPNLVKGQK